MTSCWVTASISATASGVGGAARAHRLDAVGGHDAGLGVRLEHEHLDLAPQLVLVGLAPDPAHLGQGVALDHGGAPSVRGGAPSLPDARGAPRSRVGRPPYGRWTSPATAARAMSVRQWPPRSCDGVDALVRPARAAARSAPRP